MAIKIFGAHKARAWSSTKDKFVMASPAAGDAPLGYGDGELLIGTDDNDYLVAGAGNDIVSGGLGNDSIGGRDGDDILIGGDGDDYLGGDNGNDIVRGGDGNDYLDGGNGNDIMRGGAGNDTLSGGGGNDTYQFALGDGIDTVFLDVADWGEASSDTVQFDAGIEPEDVAGALEFDAASNTFTLVLTLNGGADQVRVLGYRTYWYGDMALTVRFANGTVWDRAHLGSFLVTGDETGNFIHGSMESDTIEGRGGDDELWGDDGSDTLFGGEGNDILGGQTGDDLMAGGAGDDIYRIERFDGHDRIVDGGAGAAGGANVVRFGWGIEAAQLQFWHDGATVRIEWGEGESEDLTIENMAVDGPLDERAVSRFEFADGSSHTYHELTNHAPQTYPTLTQMNMNEGEERSFVIPDGTFVDVDAGDQLSYSLVTWNGADLPAWMTFDPLTGTISARPGYADAEVYTLQMIATDMYGKSASYWMDLYVNEVNRAPQLQTPIADQQATEAVAFSLVIPGAAFVDPDGDPLQYELRLDNDMPLPDWLSFDPVTMTLSGTPADADTGSLRLRMLAFDGYGECVTTEFTLNVANVNQAPVLLAEPADISVEGGSYFSRLIRNDIFGDADADDPGMLQIENLPAWLNFDQESGRLGGVPPLEYLGAHELNLSWTDSGGLSATAAFTLTVALAASVVVNGTAGADYLTGRSNKDTLNGFGGDDVLDGRVGADLMAGGAGNDTYYVDNAADVVIENSAEGTDKVVSSVSHVLGTHVEFLTLTGNAAINATGNAMNNYLWGNSGANVLDGQAGLDTMSGGLGNDTYIVDHLADTVREFVGEGIDRVISCHTRTLGNNQEILSLAGTAQINGTGNTLNNLIQGNWANNTLSGATGFDILQGRGGNDVLTDNSSAGNLFDGGEGGDRMEGGAGSDLFIGGASDDTIITGNGGADIIAFNRGDGGDAILSTTGADDTISLGHGILYADLALSKSGANLVLHLGAGELITLEGWYSTSIGASLGALQVVTEGGSDYLAGSSSAINDNKIEQFDFNALVAKFDEARAVQPELAAWSMASALAQFSTGGSDTAAIGGDLAYLYATQDTLSAIGTVPALAILGNPQFGLANQDLQPASILNDGTFNLY